jgi:enamine deaminase RidA (YjgF/YER057c/UK114 family)
MTSSNVQRPVPTGTYDSRPFGFSQVTIAPSGGKLAFVSGQFSGDLEANVRGDTVPEQIEYCFQNLKAAIAATGAQPTDVLKIIVLIVNHKQDYLQPLHDAIVALFGEYLPASTLIPVPRLALDGMLFEIEATLFISDGVK